MTRFVQIIRNGFLALATLVIFGLLMGANWYVRHDPERKARRLLNAQETPISEAGAVESAQKGNSFNLEQLELVAVDLGAVDGESGLTPLMAAMRAERADVVDMLLSRESVRATLDTPASDDGQNALVMALKASDFGLAQRLVDLGADPEVRFDPEWPLLVQSFREQSGVLFDFLLTNGVAPDEVGPDGMTLLAQVVDQQNGERISQLLAAGADPEAKGVTGDSLLMETVRGGNHDLAEILLKAGAAPDQIGASGQTALLAAVKAGSTAMVEMLLDHGADPNLAGKDKRSPLEIATRSQDVDLMQVLVDAGADVRQNVLVKAAFQNRDLPAMTLLLRSGADPEVKMGNGKTVLDLALAGEAENMARALLEAGASAKGRLWSALGTGNESLVQMVLDFGASVREEDMERGLPLDYALSHGHGNIVASFLAHGANPNVTRQDGESWLAAAVREGNEPMVTALLDHGACVDGIKAIDGHSLLGWSIAHGMKGVVERLVNEGADVRAREPAPASKTFTEAFGRSKTFRWHLQADSKINPLMLAAAQGDVEIAKILMDAGAQKGEYSRRYLWPVNIAAWHMDVDMMQVILGRDPDPEKQPRKVIIDLGSQRATLYEGGKATYNTRVSTGKKGYTTPSGSYVITDKHRHHNSTLYGSSMPYFMRLSCAAFGLHEGYVPNYPASHGCIRVPQSGAKFLFSKCEVGDVVEIKY